MADNPFRTGASGPTIKYPSEVGKVISVVPGGALSPADSSALLKYPPATAGQFLRVQADGSVAPSDVLQPLLDLFFHPVDFAKMWDSDSSRPAFNEYHFTTAASQMSLAVTVALAGLSAYAEIAVYVDGVPTTYPLVNGNNTVTVPLTAGTTKSVVVRNGTKAWGLTGCQLTEVTCEGMTVLVQPVPSKRLVVLGDSICCGFLCPHPTTQAFSQLVKAEGTYAVTCHSEGGYMIAQLPTVPMSSLVFDGSTDNVLWIALGYNDFAAQEPPATAAAIYGAFLDAVHAAYPNVICICQSPIVAAVEAGPTYNLGDYRTAIAAECTSRSWTRYLDGTTILVVGDLVDGVHPGAAGNTKYATKVLDVLGVTVANELALATRKFWYNPDVGRTVAAGKLTTWTDSTGDGHGLSAVAHNGNDVMLQNHAPAVECTGTHYYAQAGLGDASNDHTWCFVLDQTALVPATQMAAQGGVAITPAVSVTGNVLGMYHPGVAWEAIAGAATQTGLQVVCWVIQGTTRTVYRNGVQVGQALAQPAVAAFSPGTMFGSADGGGTLGIQGKVVSAAYCDSASAELVRAFTSWGRARVNF